MDYGTLALEKLKSILSGLNVKCIDGECRDELINFYKNVGADFTYRSNKDEIYFLNRFYIDL